MSRPSAPPDAADAAATAPRRGWPGFGLNRRSAALLVGMSAALLASELAETVVATALPTIAADLGDLRLLALVTTGYLVASTAVLPAYGWLSDRYGRRRLFVVAVALFLVGSVLGALAAGPGHPRPAPASSRAAAPAACSSSSRPRSPCSCRCGSGRPS